MDSRRAAAGTTRESCLCVQELGERLSRTKARTWRMLMALAIPPDKKNLFHAECSYAFGERGSVGEEVESKFCLQNKTTQST